MKSRSKKLKFCFELFFWNDKKYPRNDNRQKWKKRVSSFHHVTQHVGGWLESLGERARGGGENTANLSNYRGNSTAAETAHSFFYVIFILYCICGDAVAAIAAAVQEMRWLFAIFMQHFFALLCCSIFDILSRVELRVRVPHTTFSHVSFIFVNSFFSLIFSLINWRMERTICIEWWKLTKQTFHDDETSSAQSYEFYIEKRMKKNWNHFRELSGPTAENIIRKKRSFDHKEN